MCVLNVEFNCSSCCVGGTQKHLTTRIDEHLGDEGSSIFKHLRDNPECKRPDIKKNNLKF